MNNIVINTLIEMLHDRKLNDFEEIGNCAFISENENHTVLIYFFTEAKAGIKSVKNLQETYNNISNCNHIIIIYRSNITIFAKNALEEMKIQIELFQEDELKYNVTKHFLVPKHRLIDDQNEINNICDKYKCTINKFPILLKTDPISRYFDFKQGSLIEITRKSETCAEYIHYRYVT